MKNIIQASLVFFISLSITVAFGQNTRNVDHFTKVSASASVKVKLIKSNEQRIEFKMTKGDESNLVTKVKNERLIINTKSGTFGWNNNAKASVKVYFTELDEIEASAGASVKVEDPIMSNDMELEVSSGAVLDLEVEAENIEAEASTGGRLLLEGTATKGEFEVSSGANLDASTMVCDNVRAEASSGGKLKVHVNKKLKAEASSGGSIRYKGNADFTDTDSGWSGKIKKIN